LSSLFKYAYTGRFMPEDTEELVPIVRTMNFAKYEYWNETFGVWRTLEDNSFGERQMRIHDTHLNEKWAKAIFPKAFED